MDDSRHTYPPALRRKSSCHELVAPPSSIQVVVKSSSVMNRRPSATLSRTTRSLSPSNVSESESTVDLPSRSLTSANKSDSSFVDMCNKACAQSSYDPRGTTNATFKFIQRSGKESLKESIDQIKNIINQQNEAEDLPCSPEYKRRANLICPTMLALHCYAQDEYYRIILGDCEAIQVTVDAMNAFSTNELVQASANLCIGSLCTKSLRNGLKLVESGGLTSIIDSVKKFPASSNVCSMVASCLVKVTEVTDLAVSFLNKMNDAQYVLESIPESLLTFESPQNRDTVLERIR